jgi:hypothetical protein
MPWYIFLWRDGIIDHIAQHDISTEEYESVVMRPFLTGFTRKHNRPFAEGQLEDGRWIFCIYNLIDETYVDPVTAFEVYR